MGETRSGAAKRRYERVEDIPFGEYWDGRLADWLGLISQPRDRGELRQDYCFPTDKLCSEYLSEISSRPEDEIRLLLRLFLFEATTFDADHRNLRWLVSMGEKELDAQLGYEYYRRLLPLLGRRRAAPVHPGVRWVVDLLPSQPRLAIQAIESYLVAHFWVLPDGRISGLEDAMAITRARYIGRPGDFEAARLALFDLSPRDFERLVEGLYKAMGYDTELTPTARDGGRDIIAAKGAIGRTRARAD